MKMNPDWINPILGGLMIGTASGMLILGNGKIAGVSSILGELVARTKPTDWAERSLFIAGLLAAPLAYYATNSVPEVAVTSSLPLLIAGGLAVGFGARMGSGCTSGHGVSGNARFSKRSIIATLTLLTTGALTVVALNFLA